MGEYESWEESRGRIEDRFEHVENTLEAIKSNGLKLLWVGISAFLTLLGHAIMSYIQMSAK